MILNTFTKVGQTCFTVSTLIHGPIWVWLSLLLYQSLVLLGKITLIILLKGHFPYGFKLVRFSNQDAKNQIQELDQVIFPLATNLSYKALSSVKQSQSTELSSQSF